jgi:hypothetical protein
MANQIFTPGPITLFVRFRTNSTIRYLGTCVSAPEPEGEQFKIPVMNDLGGRSVPFQLIQDGEMWQVSVTMNRFDLPLCRAIRSLSSGVVPTVPVDLNTFGSETGRARGTLVLGVSDMQLFMVNTYAGTPQAGTFSPGGSAQADLNTMRAFASVNLRKYKESTAGTRVLEVAMALDCQNIWLPDASGDFARGFTIFSEATTSGIPPVN